MKKFLEIQNIIKSKIDKYNLNYLSLIENNVWVNDSKENLIKELNRNNSHFEYISIANRYDDYNFILNKSKFLKDLDILLINLYFYFEYYIYFSKSIGNDKFTLIIELSYNENHEMIFPKIFYYLVNNSNENFWYNNESYNDENFYVEKLLSFYNLDYYFDYYCKKTLEEWEEYYDIKIFLKKEYR